MLDFDKTRIREALAGKPSLLVVAYATACAQRLVNSLAAFEQYESQIAVARKAVSDLRHYLGEDRALGVGIEDQILGMIPDEDDDPGFPAAVLDDALAAVLFAIRAATASPIDSACDASARAIDTVFRFSAQAINETSFTDSSIRMIMGSRVVQREIERQYRDLAEISTGIESAKETAGHLVERASTESVLT